jgi:L-threonylcarbamoyladenylate synthase
VVREWPDAAQTLAERFWPGPLTLVLPRRPEVPEIVSAGLDTVAVRAPAHPIARALIHEVGPLAAPSANRSNRVSPTTARHVLSSLAGRIPLILDGGPTEVGIESTVLTLAGERPVVLRPGSVQTERLRALIGPVEVLGGESAGGPKTSPGQMARHYSPRAELVLVPCGDADALRKALEDGELSGAVVHSIENLPPGAIHSRLPNEPAGYARGLYAALHELDESCDRIVVEDVPDGDAWRAIADRLTRASRR